MNWTAFRSLIATAALALAAVAHAQETERMDQLIQPLVDAKQFMGSVLVARGDQVLLSRAMDGQRGVGNTEHTFHKVPAGIGDQAIHCCLRSSSWKSVASCTVEDPVKKHLPDAPAAGIRSRFSIS